MKWKEFLNEYFQKDIFDRSKKKIFPDKFADKEVLDELEAIFCNKKGIYDVDYNWKFLQNASKIQMRNGSLLKQLRNDLQSLNELLSEFTSFDGPIEMLRSHQIFLYNNYKICKMLLKCSTMTKSSKNT